MSAAWARQGKAAQAVVAVALSSERRTQHPPAACLDVLRAACVECSAHACCGPLDLTAASGNDVAFDR